ncbi:MAG: DNA alkylation repair protein [Patescibacteria group bacterium]
MKTIQGELKALGNKERALFMARYFKTGNGEYGEGDKFLGLTVSQQRVIAKKYKDLSLKDIEQLLHSTIHEYRLTALLILVLQFEKANVVNQKNIVDLYLANTKRINNWDLVDLSAPRILGNYLLDKSKERKLLYKFAVSNNIWERRIAVLATFIFIKQKDFLDSFAIAEMLLHDPNDLIHKSVGWCLREIGKINQKAEEQFLQKYYKTMPRTCLRYAIEKFSPERRGKYLGAKNHNI